MLQYCVVLNRLQYFVKTPIDIVILQKDSVIMYAKMYILI